MSLIARNIVFLFFCSMVLMSCGSGGGSSASDGDSNTDDSLDADLFLQPDVEFYIKTLQFRSFYHPGATHYELYYNADGASGFSQLATNVPDDPDSPAFDFEISVHDFDWSNALFMIKACNASSCLDSNPISLSGQSAEAIGYFKASETSDNDEFGRSVAISGDGSTLAVDGRNNSVWVFEKINNEWQQQQILTQENNVPSAANVSISISDDGATLAVGGYRGKAYIYVRNNNTWEQQAILQASNISTIDDLASFQGNPVSLSDDGNTLAIGIPYENSSATGIGGNETDLSLTDAGAVYIFSRTGSSWTQQAYLKASNTGQEDRFGYAVSLTEDGNLLAVGAPFESSASTGINGSQAAAEIEAGVEYIAGAVYIFSRSGSAWQQSSYIKASNTGVADRFGEAVSISNDGNTLAVGAAHEGSVSSGIGGNQADDSLIQAGAVYLFTYDNGNWGQNAYIKAPNPDLDDQFGISLALSNNGSRLLVGTRYEGSIATGVNGDLFNNSFGGAGAAYLYKNTTSGWVQTAYLKPSNTDQVPDNAKILHFGYGLSMAQDGQTIAIGASKEGNIGAGIQGSQWVGRGLRRGAVYLY